MKASKWYADMAEAAIWTGRESELVMAAAGVYAQLATAAATLEAASHGCDAMNYRPDKP